MSGGACGRLLACGLLALLALPANAQQPPRGRKYPPRVYRTLRIEARPPVVDGRLDDPAWSTGEWSGDYRQQIPNEGAAPSRQTLLKILYDERHVYVAIRVLDDPARVHRYPGRRDAFSGDIVGVCFDSYNGKRTGFEFDLTAGGHKIDLLLGNGETEWDTSWDPVWDGEVAHDPQGWSAEFRIPLSQLRYGPQHEQVWGLHAWRWIDRDQEEDQWQLIPRQNSGRLHQLGELHGLSGLPRSRRIELLPHVLGRAAGGPSTPGDGAEGSGSLGLDAKIGLGTNFTLDAAVNPDFGQVEADPSVLNLTAYETFYEEKRPFFLEGRKILGFGLDGSDQLFHSRRIGEAPSYVPAVGGNETLRSPGSTTILTAAKVTGRTDGGLSFGLLQALTQKETATLQSPAGARQATVEPFSSYTVARLHKDWNKGDTSLGGMLTQTHRSISDPALAFLPVNALGGGVDFARYLSGRRFLVEASGVWSHLTGDPQAIGTLQRNPVHYFQRPDAAHLRVDPRRTSLWGHGGSLRAGTSGTGRLELVDRFHWYSPGLDLNDAGYLRQADLIGNELAAGWSETRPRAGFRSYLLRLSRQDEWDFGRLHTKSTSALFANATFANKWTAMARVAYNERTDTRALFGGPALRTSGFWTAYARLGSDDARRFSLAVRGEHDWALEGGTVADGVWLDARLRPSNRLSLSAASEYVRLEDDLQYVATADTAAGSRWLLGRIDQRLWSLTFRANLALTPDLTLQYYGSPFVAVGRFGRLSRAEDTLATDYEQRFHRFGPDEITYQAAASTYSVAESGGGPGYSFPNPDFSFRELRSNLVVRWEYRPGSALYLVWQQGRTGRAAHWDGSVQRNWRALWDTRPDTVFLVKLSYWFSP